jgi:hypothetical protein
MTSTFHTCPPALNKTLCPSLLQVIIGLSEPLLNSCDDCVGIGQAQEITTQGHVSLQKVSTGLQSLLLMILFEQERPCALALHWPKRNRRKWVSWFFRTGASWPGNWLQLWEQASTPLAQSWENLAIGNCAPDGFHACSHRIVSSRDCRPLPTFWSDTSPWVVISWACPMPTQSSRLLISGWPRQVIAVSRGGHRVLFSAGGHVWKVEVTVGK